MRSFYDEIDELDGEFADSLFTKQLLQEKLRNERRRARRHAFAARRKCNLRYDDEYDKYDEYDFDSHSGLNYKGWSTSAR